MSGLSRTFYGLKAVIAHLEEMEADYLRRLEDKDVTQKDQRYFRGFATGLQAALRAIKDLDRDETS